MATPVRLSATTRGMPLVIDLGTAETLLPAGAALAEGPRWDARTQRLLWVDIDGCALHEYDPDTGKDRAIAIPAKVGAARADRRTRARVLVRSPTGSRASTSPPATSSRSPRSPTGARACAPTTARRPRRPLLDRDDVRRRGPGPAPRSTALTRDGRLTTVLEAISLSNGLGLDRRRTAHVLLDSPTMRIDVLDYDPATGDVDNRRPFARSRRRRGARRPRLDDEAASGSRSMAAPRSAATTPARSTPSSRSPPTTSPPALSAARTGAGCSSPPRALPSRSAAACPSPSRASPGRLPGRSREAAREGPDRPPARLDGAPLRNVLDPERLY